MGVTEQKVMKLLGCPETKDLLTDWDLKSEVCATVFDTSSSNTGADLGACKLLEDWLGKPVLWIACCHHVYELHFKRLVQEVTGVTKDPGVSLFRRLKSQWYTIPIDYTNLSLLEYSSLPDWMEKEARSVLDWAVKELEKKTWPRADYKELLSLTIICLGGDVPGFQFQIPGPDHHARWMSKQIYYLKMKLLKNLFDMTEDEKEQVEEICKFILVFFVKAWFKSPLSTAAAMTDLSFMANMLRYRKVTKPRYIFAVMQSCNRHLWYLTPQLILLALTDPDLSDSVKEEMANKLHSMERVAVAGGKPLIPYIDWSGEEIQIPGLASFVTPDSWLFFDLLGLSGTQDWLTIPAKLWGNFSEFQKLKEFAENIAVCNDIAERGVALISSYINKAQSEVQRQALLQVVELHRELVTGSNKAGLKLC